MHAIQQLDSDYTVIKEVDLQKDKKTALKVNGLAIILSIVMWLIGLAIRPLDLEIGIEMDLRILVIKCVVLVIGYIAYIILHEITHGLAMKHFGGQKVNYGFTGLYAFACSKEDYFDKYAYLRITLAPVVVWGIVFLVLNILIPSWFWVIWFWQLGNISGAAGDFYVAYLTSKLPDTIRVKDTGVSMTIYDKTQEN